MRIVFVMISQAEKEGVWLVTCVLWKHRFQEEDDGIHIEINTSESLTETL